MCRYRVIIVDDKWLVRSELKYMLEKFPNIEVIGEAENASDALILIKNTNPDVVFLDIQMPDLSGFDLLKKMNINFKVIFISAFKKYMEEAKKYHPVDFLIKPINAKKLSVSIENLKKSMVVGGATT